MGDLMYFLRRNSLHHSFAIARGPHPSLHHASFEMRGVEEYLRGAGRVKCSGAKFVWGPGRLPGRRQHIRVPLDPHGNTIEYTTALAVLDEDTWHPSRYDTADPMTQDQWGTADPMSELIAKDSFNDPDPLFAPPPV